MKIILTGASGMIGSEVLRQALADDAFRKVFAIVRKPLTVQHNKLKVIIHKDFLDYSTLSDVFKQADICIWCLGISQMQVGKEEYVTITHDYTIAAAKTMIIANPAINFLFTSGDGADVTEKSNTIFAREKGRTENGLQKIGFKNLYIIRPGAIKPVNGYGKVPFAYAFGYALIKILYPLIKIISRNTIIKSTEIAKAVLYIIKNGSRQKLLHSKEMIALCNA